MKFARLNIPKHISYLFFVYLSGMTVFMLFRLLLLLTETNQISAIRDGTAGLILKALVMGFRFDTVISGYILIVPFLILTFVSLIRVELKFVSSFVTIYLSAFYLFSFIVCSVDIPYFNYYFSRLTSTVLAWTDDPGFMFNMVFQEAGYRLYFIPLLIVCVVFVWSILNIRRRVYANSSGHNEATGINNILRISGYSFAVFCFLFAGIRGRIAYKSPIRVGTAYFSDNAFINQLGLNPVFTFMRSYLDDLNPENSIIRLTDEIKALEFARNQFGIHDGSEFDSPIAREAAPGGEPVYANIVLIIMENMSAEKMARYGNENNLTPNLDSLALKSLTFDNIYTAGIHTFNGLFSTLFSFPALMKQHPLKPVSMISYGGIARTLKNSGYNTIYFTTHDEEFDNVGGFFRSNGFDKIVAQKDYPSSRVKSALGVPDHYMFEYSISRLNDLNRKNEPFLAVYMTASDHAPYIIPEDIPFTPRNGDIKQKIVEYADWSIGYFIEAAKKQKWFENTLFVMVADHGSLVNNVYDMPLTYHHTPLIIYAPEIIAESGPVDGLGGQIDIFPTIMGLLNIPYINNTMGVDLLKEHRPFIYFSADDKIGCLNDEFFYVIRTEGGESLYRYRKRDTKNYLDLYPELADSMKEYVYSMLQVSQWMASNRLVGQQK